MLSTIGSDVISTPEFYLFLIPFLLALLSYVTRRKKLDMYLGIDKYMNIIGNQRTKISVAELARAAGTSEKKVKSNIKRAIRAGIIPQGHLGITPLGAIVLYLTDKAFVRAGGKL